MWPNKQLQLSSIGLENFLAFAGDLDSADPVDFQGFPKYDLTKPSDDTWLIEIALAGYKKEDILIEHKDGKLIVSSEKINTVSDKHPVRVIHKGLTKKAFMRTFALADTIIVEGASFTDGILSISLKEILPDEKKPKRININ